MRVAAQNTQQTGNQGTLQRTADRDQTVPEQVYADYALTYDEDDAALNGKIPDVLVDAPVVSLKDLDFELDELRAKVSLFAKVLDLVELSVGIDAYLGKVKLTIESIDVQALVKVRLDNVAAILDRVLTTIDRNPQVVQEITRDVGPAVEDVGQGTGNLVGRGASEAISDIGTGAGSAVEDVGEGAGEAVEDVGEGAGSAVEDVGGGAGQAAHGATDAAGQTAQQVQDTVEQAAGQAQDAAGSGARQAQDGGAGRATEQGDGQQQGASEQVPGATQAAQRLAEKLGVELAQIKGSGVGERITVRDVRNAAQNG